MKLNNTKITKQDAKCVIEYVGLSFLYLTYYNNQIRLLENDKDKNDTSLPPQQYINTLANETYDKYVRLMLYLNRSISDIENNYEDVYILVPVSLNTYIYIWTNNIYSLQKYKELSISSKVPYLDMKPHTIVQYSGFNEIYMEVAFHQNISNTIENYTNPSKIARFKRTNINEKENSYDQEDIEDDYTILFDLSENEDFNKELYEYYGNKGIDIYNPNDKAFKDSCFISKNFDYDLTQKFRKNNLFQHKTFVGLNDECKYGGYNQETGYVSMIYTSLDITGYQSKEFDLGNKNKEDNLVIKCAKEAKNLQDNLIVLIYLIVFVILVSFDILVFIFCVKKRINADNALKNDDFEICQHVNVESNEGVDPNQIKLSTKGLWEIITKNFMTLHPLLRIFSPSIIQPQLFNVTILFFNLFLFFGLNAFYYNIFDESMIEKRIFDKHRNNMIYPIRNEFLKIVYSILTSIILTLIIRIINFTKYEKKKQIQEDLRTKSKDDVIEYYSNKMFKRRLFAGMIMLIISIFLTFYVCVFCLIYVNTQKVWLYSGIWTILINWIIFSNIYIILISVIENLIGSDKISYLMKQLFIF